jgi:hypothetical protein
VLERFKDYETVVIDCESFEEIMVLREVLVKEGLKENIHTSLKNCNVVSIYPKEKRFACYTRIEIPVGNTNFHNFNHYITNFKSIINLDMKKKMYLSKDQLRCIEYVDEVLEDFEVMDLYYDKEELIVKARHIWSSEEFEREFDYFFREFVVKNIEEDFYECMSMDWDDLDKEYEILKLSRKCMRELK